MSDCQFCELTVGVNYHAGIYYICKRCFKKTVIDPCDFFYGGQVCGDGRLVHRLVLVDKAHCPGCGLTADEIYVPCKDAGSHEASESFFRGVDCVRSRVHYEPVRLPETVQPLYAPVHETQGEEGAYPQGYTRYPAGRSRIQVSEPEVPQPQ